MIYTGDCIEILQTLQDNTADSIVTDPPAGIGFMGKEWDYFPNRPRGERADGQAENRGFARGVTFDSSPKGRDGFISFMTAVFTQCLRVLKPGGHALVWALPRTSHWTAFACENAGFEIRDIVHHIFGSGFPKALDISKAIDKEFNLEREVVGKSNKLGAGFIRRGRSDEEVFSGVNVQRITETLTTPASPEAQQWNGWKTALKPATEHWILCRKPLSESTVAQNVLKWGCGGLNVKECAVPTEETWIKQDYADRTNASSYLINKTYFKESNPAGRFPSNLILDGSECVVREFPETGVSKWGKLIEDEKPLNGFLGGLSGGGDKNRCDRFIGDSGSAARFFYQAKNNYEAIEAKFTYKPKPSPAERNAGLDGFEKKQGTMQTEMLTGSGNIRDAHYSNHHPTVKSISLCEYLIKLITPPSGTVLDCFAGSGSTLCAAAKNGFKYIGIEQNPEYVEIAKARVKFWENYTEPEITGEGIENTNRKIINQEHQYKLFA